MNHAKSEIPGRPAAPRRRWAILRVAEAAGQALRNQAFRRLLLATPALLIGLGVPLAIPALRADPGEIRRLYEGEASSARQHGDAATAGVCLDRLTLLKTQSGLTSPEFDYQLAKLSLELGQVERAEVLLEGVALEDRPVHAPAHLMRAALLLRRTEGRAEPTRSDGLRAERHLRHALALDPEMPKAHEILGQIALNSGDLARAEGHMRRAAKTNPGLNYQVALALNRQGQAQSAAFWARRASEYYSQISDKEPNNHAARMMWASSEVILGEHEAARTILDRGLALANIREYHQLLASSYLMDATEQAKNGKIDPGARLTLLEKALKHDPTNPNLVEQISEMLKGGGLEADRFRGQLRALLAEGQALTTVHLLLGYDAWEHDRPEEARVHWELAFEANPKSSIVANNLAWALATGPNLDLPRALKLVDLALDFHPAEPSLLSTRGRILARLERWKEAISSLEAALPAMPENRDLHADLAATYTALNMSDLAEHHRRLAVAMSPPKSPKVPTP